jgi:hypothetical protein
LEHPVAAAAAAAAADNYWTTTSRSSALSLFPLLLSLAAAESGREFDKSKHCFNKRFESLTPVSKNCVSSNYSAREINAAF